MMASTGSLGATTLARQLGDWQPVGTRPAYLALADTIRVLLLDGRLPVGSALPGERGLADQLGVSRTTVAGAYNALRESGHLESRQGARSVLCTPVTIPAEPMDLGSDGEIRLNVAAPTAPEQVLHDGYRHALECAPRYLAGSGLYPAGLRALAEVVAARYTERGLPTRPEQILVTAGAQHALRLVLDSLVSPGDHVVVEQPTYYGAILSLRRHSVRPLAIGLHPEFGWDLDHLESVVRQRRPRFIFTLPDFHNPTGLLLDEAGRIRLGEISAKYRVPVVVDETMVELGLDCAPPLPVAALAPPRAQIITIGSASKTVWAGLRIGWIRTGGRGESTDRFASARFENDIAGAVVEQFAAAYALDHLDDFLPGRVAELRRRRGVALDAIAEHLPGAVPVRGAGGLCLWVSLPQPVAAATAAAATELGVRLIPGALFGPTGGFDGHLRIPYVLPPEVLEQAIGKVGEAYLLAAGGKRSAGESPDRLVV